MLKLLRTNDGMFGVKYQDKTTWFTFKYCMIVHMMLHYGTPKDDIQYAVECMIRHNHMTADFGVLGGFISTQGESNETWD